MSERNGLIYAVATSGDGQHTCRIVRGLEHARKELAAQLWFGPYEDAQGDTMVGGILRDFDDIENHWSDGGRVFHVKLEQAWVDVQIVDQVDV